MCHLRASVLFILFCFFTFFLFFSFSFVSFHFLVFSFRFFLHFVFLRFFSLLFSLFSFRLFSFLFVFSFFLRFSVYRYPNKIAFFSIKKASSLYPSFLFIRHLLSTCKHDQIFYLIWYFYAESKDRTCASLCYLYNIEKNVCVRITLIT